MRRRTEVRYVTSGSSGRVLYLDRHGAPRDFGAMIVDTRANFQNSCVPRQEGRERKIEPHNE